MSGAAGARRSTVVDPAAATASPPSLIRAALGGLCPRCGAKTLFVGVAGFAPACANCGLDFTTFNVGDGPAAFLTLILGAIVTTGAVTLELAVGPPWWVHALIWPPLIVGGVILSLRAAKAALLAAEYRAREGAVQR